jgi:integrase
MTADTETKRHPIKLTKRTVDALAYEGTGNGACYCWDSEVKGFGIRIYPGGRKAFLVAYRTGNRKRFLTLGTYGKDLTADEARKLAIATLGDVIRGADPAQIREQERQGETIRDLCAAYMERHGAAKRSANEDQRRIDRHILPKWATLKARAIKRADVAALHTKIGKTAPYEANRTLALLSKMFELARRWGFVPEGHPNPVRDIDRFKEHKRDRWVTADELPRLAEAINTEQNETARCALWLYLLTGARKSELLRAEWDHIDWTRAELRLPDTKAGRILYIPLSAPALELLRTMPRVDSNPYILPGKVAGAHLVNISKPWDRVREAATLAGWRTDPRAAALIDRLTEERTRNKAKHCPIGYTPIPSVAEIRAAADFPFPPSIDDVRLHDLRRTVGSWLAQAGNSLHLIGRVLNHSNTSTTAIYARFGEDSVRAALEQHGARIMGAAGLTPPAEITELPAPKARDKRRVAN